MGRHVDFSYEGPRRDVRGAMPKNGQTPYGHYSVGDIVVFVNHPEIAGRVEDVIHGDIEFVYWFSRPIKEDWDAMDLRDATLEEKVTLRLQGHKI